MPASWKWLRAGDQVLGINRIGMADYDMPPPAPAHDENRSSPRTLTGLKPRLTTASAQRRAITAPSTIAIPDAHPANIAFPHRKDVIPAPEPPPSRVKIVSVRPVRPGRGGGSQSAGRETHACLSARLCPPPPQPWTRVKTDKSGRRHRVRRGRTIGGGDDVSLVEIWEREGKG